MADSANSIWDSLSNLVSSTGSAIAAVKSAPSGKPAPTATANPVPGQPNPLNQNVGKTTFGSSLGSFFTGQNAVLLMAAGLLILVLFLRRGR